MEQYTKQLDELIIELQSDINKGLSNEEATKRLEKYGENRLAEKGGKSILQILWHQINNALTYILLLAVGLSIWADHTTDAVIIVLLILTNVSISFYHEYKAEKRVKSLKNLITKKCNVIRGGELIQVDTRYIVPGDLIQLEDGQAVPADLRIVEAKELSAIESSLTGESSATTKKVSEIPNNTPLGDRTNMLYMGTHITSGEAKAIVVGTGLSTELGKISRQLDDVQEHKSLFLKRTETLMKQMIVISSITTVFIIILLFIKDYDRAEIPQFAFATIISGIPEGLPSILTVLLSIASVRMSRKKALLRNLPSIETLSTVTTIITDKTGTLTQNVMKIDQLILSDSTIVNISGEGWESEGDFTIGNEKINPNDNEVLIKSLDFLALTSKGDAVLKDGKYELFGYPTEISRYVLAKKASISKETAQGKYSLIDQTPYNQDLKFKSALLTTANNNERYLVIVGGAENILKRCKKNPDLEKYVNDSAAEGYRMQAIAYLKLEDNNQSIHQILESRPEFIPLSVFRISDPIRANVPQAIKDAHSAGIRVIMATGDHLVTAFSIAKQAGIIPTDAKREDIYNYALSEVELERMSESQFIEAVNSIDIFARVTPSTKLRIAEVLQRKGEVIAMTGDGVNDAPVLKRADIGISMGLMGTDVAKESSDLILMDDSFATIIDAIEEGRTVFKNIRQTSLYLITTNLAEDLMVLAAILLGYPLPLLAIQILWLNLVTDGLSDMALATEKSYHDILLDKPRSKSDGIITTRDIKFILLIGTLMGLLSIIAFSIYFEQSLDKARTVAFTLMVFTQLFNVINMRSLNNPIYQIGYFTNKAINISIIISVILFLLALYTPSIKTIFKFESLSILELLTLILISSSVLLVGEFYKGLRSSRLIN